MLVLSLSCVKQGGGILGSGEKGSITFICGGGDDYYETKTTLNGLTTHWIENLDRVGLFSLQACVGPGGVPGIANLPLTAVTSGERALFQGSVPVSLPRIQTQSEGDNVEHIASLDFLVSKPTMAKYPGVSGSGAAISLRYNHVFTVLEFKIRKNSGTGSITKITLKGVLPLSFESAKINLAQETPASGNPYFFEEMNGFSNEVVLSFESPITPGNDFNNTPKAYMVILPWNTPNTMTVCVEIDGCSDLSHTSQSIWSIPLFISQYRDV